MSTGEQIKELCDWKRETYYVTRRFGDEDDAMVPEYSYFCKTHGLPKSETHK